MSLQRNFGTVLNLGKQVRFNLVKYYCNQSSENEVLNMCNTNDIENSVPQKILKVAIIGVPNAGKSTLINQLVRKNVFGVSEKVHTTRCRARAMYVQGDTQIVFLDTPGLVTASEATKHHLESSFLEDSEEAIREADIVGVLQDTANKYTRNRLDPKVLRLLYLYYYKEFVLILNKVDKISSKRLLLDCVRILTNGNMRESFQCTDLENPPPLLNTEADLQERIKDEKGWSYFKDVFMVSALNGNGVGDINMYLLQKAKPGEWLFSRSEFTDQNQVKLIEHIVHCKLLDNLPQEIPYNLEVILEYLNVEEDNSITAVILIACNTPRIERIVKGSGGSRIRNIAQQAEVTLRQLYVTDIRLKLVITNKAQFKNAYTIEL